MGLLNRFFGKSSDLEHKLEELCSASIRELMGVSPAQAEDIARQLMAQAKVESRAERSSELPPHFGDSLLEKESIDESVKLMLTKKRSEGVRDEDIRWWWNMHDIERRMMVKFDDWSKLTLFIKFREENGYGPDMAMVRVRKLFPIFGDPEDTTHASGQDRPLPYELKERINAYIEFRSKTNPKALEQDLERYTSCNSLIREEIDRGAI